MNDTRQHDEKKDSLDESKDDNYLFDKLLDMVKKKSKENLHNLDNNLKLLIDKDKYVWNDLVKWDLKNNGDNKVVVRQDNIVNGIISRYKESDLIHHTSASFNSHKFCDFNDYLPKLVLLAHMVDDEFQESVRNIFDINVTNGVGNSTFNEKDTLATMTAKSTTTFSIETLNDIMNEIENESKINQNDSNNNINASSIRRINAIEYTRGPVKLYSRALSKSEIEYQNELYPTSACVLDFNRCTLTFNSIETLLTALNLFVNKVKYYQSGNIIKIVRCKNTFKNYVNEGPGYADMKLNVIIKGNTNNIIGEVQFLLSPMLNFKKKEHNLYSVQRQETFIKSSLSLILPRLLDTDKQLFVAANMGNVIKLCEIMVLNNLNEKSVLKIDQTNNQTILHSISALGHMKALYFIKSIVPNDLSMNHLFVKNRHGSNSIDASITSKPVFKQFFSDENIIKKYKNDQDLLIHLLFEMALHQTNDTLRVLIEMIGDEAFVKGACMPHRQNVTILETAAIQSNTEMIGILLSYKEIVQQYKTSKYWLFRLLFHLFGHNHHNLDMIDHVFKRLELFVASSDDAKSFVINTIFKYRYNESIKKENLNEHCWNYGKYTILSRIGWSGNVNTFKKFISIVGDKPFAANALVPDYVNTTILERAIRSKKVDIIEMVLSYDEIKQEIVASKYWLYRILWWLFRGEYDSSDTIMFVIDQLNLSKDSIVDLVTNYRYQEMTSNNKLRDNAWDYRDSNILTGMTYFGDYISLKTLCSIVGETTFSKFVFVRDEDNTTALECAIHKNKVKMIKFMVSLDDVKTVYQSQSYWTYRLFWLYENVEMKNEDSLFKGILKDLNLSKKQMIKLVKKYTYKERNDNLTFASNSHAVKCSCHCAQAFQFY